MSEMTRGIFITNEEMQGDNPESIKAAMVMAKGIQAVINHGAPQMARDLKKGNPGITDDEIKQAVSSYVVRVVKVPL